MDLVVPAAVAVACGASIASSTYFSDRIRQVSVEYRQLNTPKSRAFLIWWVIYSATFAACAAQLAGSEQPKVSTGVAHAVALALTSVWPPLFRQDTLAPAALVLVLAAAVAASAAADEQAWQTGSQEAILSSLPLSLLAGWLLVAAGLGVSIAFGGAEAVAHVVTVVVAVLAFAIPDPILAVGQAWALLNTRVFSLLLVGSVGLLVLAASAGLLVPR
jgi:pheromone shutdown protein TraB